MKVWAAEKRHRISLCAHRASPVYRTICLFGVRRRAQRATIIASPQYAARPLASGVTVALRAALQPLVIARPQAHRASLKARGINFCGVTSAQRLQKYLCARITRASWLSHAHLILHLAWHALAAALMQAGIEHARRVRIAVAASWHRAIDDTGPHAPVYHAHLSEAWRISSLYAACCAYGYRASTLYVQPALPLYRR